MNPGPEAARAARILIVDGERHNITTYGLFELVARHPGLSRSLDPRGTLMLKD